MAKYFLSINDVEGSEKEVTKEQFVRAERNAGFRPKRGLPADEPCTSGFSNGQVMGRIDRNENKFTKCKLGLYEIFWTSGGSSLAAVSNDREGNRMMAPCNWVNTDLTPISKYADQIKTMKLIRAI